MNIDGLQRIFGNPFYAINIDPSLAFEHQTMITKDEWVEVNLRTMLEDDNGNKYAVSEEAIENIKSWLYRLLDILEGNYPVGEGGSPDGYIPEGSK